MRHFAPDIFSATRQSRIAVSVGKTTSGHSGSHFSVGKTTSGHSGSHFSVGKITSGHSGNHFVPYSDMMNQKKVIYIMYNQ